MPERGDGRETARLEAFSDAVFAIAATILVLDLRLPTVKEPTASTLIDAVLDQWPSYFAFALSFATILILWILHHARMGLIYRIDGLLMFANGLVLFMVATLAFPTAIVGEYLTEPAAEGAVFIYAVFVLATNGAYNVFMLAFKPQRGLLRAGVPGSIVATTAPSCRDRLRRLRGRGRTRAGERVSGPWSHHRNVGVLGRDRLPGAQRAPGVADRSLRTTRVCECPSRLSHIAGSEAAFATVAVRHLGDGLPGRDRCRFCAIGPKRGVPGYGNEGGIHQESVCNAKWCLQVPSPPLVVGCTTLRLPGRGRSGPRGETKRPEVLNPNGAAASAVRTSSR